VSFSMKYYRNDDGNLQIESEPSATVIASFLIEDLQDSPTACREILMVVEAIARGEVASWRRVGNAYTLALSSREAAIEPLFKATGKTCLLILDDFREIVERWLHFLEGS
jgi:hypothetical protein